MVAKSVVQIDIEDGQFRDFYALYQEYQQQLENCAAAWADTNDAIGDAEDAMGKLLGLSGHNADAVTIAAYQANVIVKELRQASVANAVLLGSVLKNTKAQKGFADESERGNRALEKMKKSADGVAHSIFGIGKWLLKLGAWGGGLAGLGGLLSGLGLKDLASSAVNTQRSARGLGMTPGQLTAFNQDYGRYVDPGTLGTIADAQNNYAGRMWLSRAAGMDINQVSSADPGQLAGQLAIRAHDWWTNTPESMRTAENLQSTGFSQAGFSLSMMRQLGNTPIEELRRASSQYQQDQGRFNVGDKSTDAWYNFLRQIKDAGNTIESDLKNKLVALAPNLQHFVEVIGKDAMKLIDGIFTPANLSALEAGIDNLTKYLGSSQFQQDIKDIAGLVGALAGAMRKTAKFLGIDTTPSPESPSPKSPVDIPVNPGLDPNEVRRETHGRVAGFGGISSMEKALGYARHFLTMPQHPSGPYANPKAADEAKNFLAALDAKNGLPPGTLEAMWAKESSEGKNLVGPVLPNGDQAIGDFQFTGQAWKDWGKGGDRFSFRDEADAAGRFMGSLSKKYGGDVSKALAAYNWGPGNVDKAVSQNGSNWQNSLPGETRDYINKIASSLKRQPQSVKVVVQNSTSARVAVQANAAAAQ